MKYTSFAGERRQEPRLLHAERDPDIAPGDSYGPIICDIYLVECCIEGGGVAVICGREFQFRAGDCFIIFPGDSVEYRADPTVSRRCLWCAIDGLQISSALKRAEISSKSPFLSPGCFTEVRDIILRMIEICSDNDGGADYRRSALVYSLLGAMLREYSVPDKNVWVERAIGIIETNYHRDINVTSIAAEVGLDRSYFSTLFKSRTGMTPASYLAAVRIRKACVLMSEQGCSVGVAAEAVGIDPQNFSRIFRRVTGKTPGQYNKELCSIAAKRTE